MFNIEMVLLNGHGNTVCLAGTGLSTGELSVKLLEVKDRQFWKKRRLIGKENGLPEKLYKGLVNVAMAKTFCCLL